MNRLSVYKEFDRALKNIEYINDIELDEEFIPAHKQAGFVPYDIVLLADPPEGTESLTEDDITELLESTELPSAEIVGIKQQHDMYYDSECIVYLSLY
jgi:hypothetical protein